MILDLKGIYKDYQQGKMTVPVLKEVDFSMEEGEYVAIMGPSGSGKTTLMNIIGCLDKPTKGTFLLNGEDIAKCTENEMSDIRLKTIGFVFQSFHLLPRQSALTNVELPLNYARVPKKERRERARKALERVGLADRVDFKPNQLSGGQMQRVAIARAIVNNPKLLLADEPTTALDVTIQAQIIKLIKDLQKEFGYTIVFITHDLGVVANVADRVAVLYAGQIVELGTVEEVFYDPRHPYTWALLSSLPQLMDRGMKLYSIAGTPPSLYNDIVGDAFAPRNPYCLRVDTLREPPMFKVSDTHYAKTWLLDPRAPKVEKPEMIRDIHGTLMKVFNI